MTDERSVSTRDVDPADPYEREAQTFPVLDAEMVQRIAKFGTEEQLPEGAMLFSRGDRGVDFFVVLEGAVEIYDVNEKGELRPVRVHRAHEFTGELDLFNNRRSLVNARALEAARVIRVKREAFRRLVSVEPDVGEIVMRAFILRRVGLISHAQGAIVLVGPCQSADMLRIQRFLMRNGYPYRVLDTDTDEDAEGFLQCFKLSVDDLPVVVFSGDTVLRNPTNVQVADVLGFKEDLDPSIVYDVAVIGAGPSGLAVAVYAASEGLSTLVIEELAPGGQAGTSSKIENYLGFPTGISGQALAGRAQVQAQKFGARLAISRPVVAVDCNVRPYRVKLGDGTDVSARSVVIASGARYRKLAVPNYERFEGRGIHYAATAIEAQLCVRQEVVVVGGGNSAGQAAVFLARSVARVYMLVRGDKLAATMSDYLIHRIEASPRITLLLQTEIVSLEGESTLEHVQWTNRKNGETTRKGVSNVFAMLGAEPSTKWLGNCVRLDDKGFVLTAASTNVRTAPTGASPLGGKASYGGTSATGASPFGTSIDGVYAVGDVRAGSVKRVASAVGEGSVVVQAIHGYLSADPAR